MNIHYQEICVSDTLLKCLIIFPQQGIRYFAVYFTHLQPCMGHIVLAFQEPANKQTEYLVSSQRALQGQYQRDCLNFADCTVDRSLRARRDIVSPQGPRYSQLLKGKEAEARKLLIKNMKKTYQSTAKLFPTTISQKRSYLKLSARHETTGSREEKVYFYSFVLNISCFLI